jgi:DNA-binding transcriptional LysR family regulator
LDYLLAMRLFVRSVELGSFSRAAMAYNLQVSSVSRHISNLEQDLGSTLLRRSTRQILLTDAGANFYERAARILEDLEQARRAASATASQPIGTLKLRAPTEFGAMHLVPGIAAFMAQTPGLSMDLHLTDEDLDTGSSQYDISILVGGKPEESRFYAQKFAPNRYVICCAPSYIARASEPKVPSALRDHNCLVHGDLQSWQFGSNRSTVEVAVVVAGNFRSNRMQPILAAALAGEGFARLPCWLAGADLRSGALVPILPNYDVMCADTMIYGLYPEKSSSSPKMRVFLEFFMNRIGATPYWDP